ncbi:MAG: DUF4065 domain-containing protein [Phycisphaerales bacterium]
MSLNPAIPSAESIARYFIYLAGRQRDPVPLTQMHLHKLLYYAQGWYLATRMKPLFADELQAWRHGPVVASVYPTFKHFGKDAITFDQGREGKELTLDQRAVVESVWRRLRNRSAASLRNKTHRESPWIEARKGLGKNDPARTAIPHESLRNHFGSLHVERCRKLGVDPVMFAESIAQAERGEGVDINLLN